MTTKRTVRPFTPQEREARHIIGKGWSVCDNLKHKSRQYAPFAAVVVYPDRSKKFVGIGQTREEAARLAVSAAHDEHTLDWKKSVAWFRVFGWELSYDDAFSVYTRVSRKKGWQVKRNNGGYTAHVGFDDKNLKYIGIKPTKKYAISLALNTAKTMNYYNESATIIWLQRHGFEDLIPLAKVSKKEGKAA
jgi:hypothetical protein